MTSDLRDLRATLRARAEAGIDPEALLASVGPACRRRRTRRLAGSTAALAAAAVLAALLAPRVLGGHGAAPAPLPMTSVQSAAPGGIGSDPETFHFAVGPFPYPVTDDRWTADTNVEELYFEGEANVPDPRNGIAAFGGELTLRPASVTPTLDPTAPEKMEIEQARSMPATIGGRPGTVVTGTIMGVDAANLVWAPADGVRAELDVHGPLTLEQVLAFAGSVRVDQPHACRLRLRPATLPTGARVKRCVTQPTFGGGSLSIEGPGGTIDVTVPGEAVFGVGVSPGATGLKLPNGWVYEQLSSDGYHTASIRVVDPYAQVSAHGRYGLADVLLVAGGLQPS